MKFYIYSLGCKVNAYESNVMKDNLKNNGFIESSVDEADIVIINSCTVTNTADNKTMKLIRHVRNHYDVILAVVGCFVQTCENLSLVDADILIGNKNKSKINEYINNFISCRTQIVDISNDLSSFEKMCLNNYDRTRAFIKIQDGCNNYCSFCIIPYARGGVRSKPKEDVLAEVKSLVSSGHKEIVLTGIHTGNYGAEFKDYDFACLLSDLVKIDGLDRLRISSIEITEINDRVMDVIKNNDILVDHMHIPLQSGSDTILKSMNRKYDMKYFFNKINCLRKIRPDMSITTDVIVGFPGETDELFLETVNSIKEIGFTKLHVFPYSKRTGTKASLMDNQIDESIKKQRVRVLLDLSKELEIKYMQLFIGRKVTFIPEVKKDGYLIGHTGNYLLVKYKGNSLSHDIHSVVVKSIDYPYCICE